MNERIEFLAAATELKEQAVVILESHDAQDFEEAADAAQAALDRLRGLA